MSDLDDKLPSVYRSNRGTRGGSVMGRHSVPPKKGQGINVGGVEWRELIIDSKQANERCFKSPMNPRSTDFLNEESLSDILGGIRAAGENDYHVYAVEHNDGKLEVLAGLRRTTAVQLSPGTKLKLFVVKEEEIDQQTKRKLATTSDIYSEPSRFEWGLHIKKRIDQLVESGEEEPSLEQLAQYYGRTKTFIQQALRTVEIPESLVKKVGHPDYLSKSVANFFKEKKFSEEYCEELIDDFEVPARESEQSLEAYKKLLTRVIKKHFSQEKPRHKEELSSVWNKTKLKAGVRVARDAQNNLVLKISRDLLSPELERALAEHLRKR